MSERIGFFICHCGINIASKVRVEEVAEYAATFPNVIVAKDYLFMCSDPGQDLIEKEIKRLRTSRMWWWPPARPACMKTPFGPPASGRG